MAAGAFVAGVPVAAIHHGVDVYIERQSGEDVRLSAQLAIARTEWRIGQTIEALGAVGKSGIAACTDIDRDAVGRAVLTTSPVKQISVMDADGVPACAPVGAMARPTPLSRELRTADDRVYLSVVQSDDFGGRALRISWRHGSDPLQLFAYLPADVFLLDGSSAKAASIPVVRIMLNEGTLIAAPSGMTETPADDGDTIRAFNQSTRYPLIATSTVSRTAVLAEHGDLRTAALMVEGVLALLTITLALLLPLRTRSNPIVEMERALENGEFVPYYQPVVDLRSGRIVGAEVLMRWRKADGTVVPPGNFIPLAESSGLIIDMTRTLMVAVREEFGAVLGRRPKAKFGFNLSARHFDDDRILADVRDIFSGSPIRMSQIVLEVTEREPLEDLDAARRIIAGLQELGCKIAIDDVGTGHGGLSYMLKFGANYIKIDKMFVDAIGSERHSMTIIETLINLARDMRMEVFAEGVETLEQVKYLRERGIYLAQGFAFAPPLPGPQFRELFEAAYPLGSNDPTPPATPAVSDFIAARSRVAAA
jgi:sensor c-di-GMP phosphodiesterase-like protein